jgi:hypothetical protein
MGAFAIMHQPSVPSRQVGPKFSPSTFPVLDTSGTERISGNHFIQEDGGMSFLPACRE